MATYKRGVTSPIVPPIQQPPTQLPPPSAGGSPAQRPRAKRPAFALIAVVGVVIRLGREVLARQWHGWGALVGAVLGLAAIVGWRLVLRSRRRTRGGHEQSPDEVRDQIVRAGAPAPAYPEDGTLRGASVLVVNQRTKLVEVNTQYDVYGVDGRVLGHVTQVGQSRAKQVARVLTSFDQFFTHQLDVCDAEGNLLLRLVRPRKVFRTRVNVYDCENRYLGCLQQENVFGHVRFGLRGADGASLGLMRAENWRAWDFVVRQPSGVEVARITKSWEGWMRTFSTNADRYVVRIHHRLGGPLHALVLAAALGADLALKQDARGLG